MEKEYLIALREEFIFGLNVQKYFAILVIIYRLNMIDEGDDFIVVVMGEELKDELSRENSELLIVENIKARHAGFETEGE